MSHNVLYVFIEVSFGSTSEAFNFKKIPCLRNFNVACVSCTAVITT